MTAAIALCALVWVAIVGLVIRRTTAAGDSVGLPTALLLATSFMYGGAFVFALPGYSHLRPDAHWYLATLNFSEATVLSGLFATLLGLAGFALGCGAFTARRLPPRARAPLRIDPGFRRKLFALIAVIVCTGLILHAARVSFPMSAAILQVTRNLAVALICLGAALVVLGVGRRGLARWYVLAALLPAYFLLVWGFVSYGFVVFTIYAGFWLAVLRPPGLARWKIALSSAAILYLLLVLFVAWMSFRAEVRGVIWHGGDLSARLAVLWRALSGIELLGPGNLAALDWLAIRLNQTMMVGKVVEWHAHHPELRLHGATLWVVALAWVPRLFWPGKPKMGGSAFMAEHTGRSFSESSTFGSGPVIEFYVNFGYPGIFLGFVALGLCLHWLDRRASTALRRGDLFGFLIWFTAGIAFIAPTSMMMFVGSSALMALILLGALRTVVLTRRTLRVA